MPDDEIGTSDERYIVLKTGGKRQRGGMLLEAMVAVVILTIGFLCWAGSMMGASQGQYHAQKHTESIMIANYLLEQMRRDPNIFGQEFLLNQGGCNGSNCWQANAPAVNDACSNPWPAYADTGPTNAAGWHTGCQNLTLETNATVPEPYNFQWRADIHAKGTAQEDDSAADLTVWVETQTLHGGWDTYEVTGVKKESRS
jgi:Tfp pilus assembly protein PilV